MSLHFSWNSYLGFQKMKEFEGLGWHHPLGWAWGPLQSFDFGGTARMLSCSSGASPSTAPVLQTGSLGLHISPQVQHYLLCFTLQPNSQRIHDFSSRNALKSRNCLINTMNKGEKCPYKPSSSLRRDSWDPRHGDISAPPLLEAGGPRWILPMNWLCCVYVGLTDRAVMVGCLHSTALLVCVPVCWHLIFFL